MHSVKFLIDADMPRSIVEIIRSFGFDVEDVRDIGMGTAKDKEIIEYAVNDNRIMLQEIPILAKCFDIQGILGQSFLDCHTLLL